MHSKHLVVKQLMENRKGCQKRVIPKTGLLYPTNATLNKVKVHHNIDNNARMYMHAPA